MINNEVNADGTGTLFGVISNPLAGSYQVTVSASLENITGGIIMKELIITSIWISVYLLKK